jgi:hypothetical protein
MKSGFRPEFFQIFAAAAVLFALGAMTQIGVPGIYQDSVTPDFIVVKFLNPGALGHDTNLPLLFHRFPILFQIYHGALPYYVGLPFYALFGTGILGIRIANMAFGLLVLAGAALFLMSFRVRPWLAAVVLALLALDAGFLFSFRTQFYITMLPVAAVFASAALVEFKKDTPGKATAFWSGFLAGLACYGYFVHIAFVPALAALAYWRWRRAPALKYLIACWIGGFVIPVLPYIAAVSLWLGLSLLHSHSHLLEYMQSTTQRLRQGQGGPSSFSVFADLMFGTISAAGPTKVMLGEPIRPLFAGIKTFVLLGLPFLALLAALPQKRDVTGPVFIFGLVAGFFILVLYMNSGLGLHHAIPLLPLLYAGLALSLEQLCATLDRYGAVVRRSAVSVSFVLVGIILVSNLCCRYLTFAELSATGGVGLYSNAIVRYEEDAMREKTPVLRYFPDWGLFGSFSMVTSGMKHFIAGLSSQTAFPAAAAKEALCSGTDFEVALMDVNSKSRENRLKTWTTALEWAPPAQKVYLQDNGVPVLWSARWHASDGASCRNKATAGTRSVSSPS